MLEMKEKPAEDSIGPILVDKNECPNYIKYFEKHQKLRLLIITSLENRMGDLYVDDKESPNVILLATKYFVAFYGDPSHPLVHQLLEIVPIHRFMLFPSDDWIPVIKKQYGRLLIHKPSMRFKMSANDLNIEFLRELRQQYYEKYDYSDFEFGRLKRDDEEKVPEYLWEHFLVIMSKDELFNDGLAYVAKDKEGNVLSMSGTGHIPYKQEYEVQIVTIPKQRGKGLSMIATIDLLIDSLERGLTPHWDAADERSSIIAEKLGYTDKENYDIFVRTNTLVWFLRASRIPKVIIWSLRKLKILDD